MLLAVDGATAVVTLVAVLVGAIASAAGSVFVNRHELTRGQRIRIFDELLPTHERAVEACLAEVHRGQPLFRSNAGADSRALIRAATLASHEDLERALTIAMGWEDVLSVTDGYGVSDPMSGISVGADVMLGEEQAPRLVKLRENVEGYRAWLTEKFR